jgi:hypothetical protein
MVVLTFSLHLILLMSSWQVLEYVDEGKSVCVATKHLAPIPSLCSKFRACTHIHMSSLAVSD